MDQEDRQHESRLGELPIEPRMGQALTYCRPLPEVSPEAKVLHRLNICLLLLVASYCNGVLDQEIRLIGLNWRYPLSQGDYLWWLGGVVVRALDL